MRLPAISLLSLLFCNFLPGVWGVRRDDFKECHQSGFCRRGRAIAERAANASIAGQNWESPYSIIDANKISFNGASFEVPLVSTLYPDARFSLEIGVLYNGAVRVKMDEVEGLRKRYNEAPAWALVDEKPPLMTGTQWKLDANKKGISIEYSDGVSVRVRFSPLRIALLRNGREETVLNERGLLHMEHYRTKPAPPPEAPSESSEGPPTEEGGDQKIIKESEVRLSPWFEGDKEDDWWEETFRTWKDTKPKGPESFNIDITFPTHGHVYGIPQRATPLSLPETRGDNAKYSDPYRMYNADVFEYVADSPMSLYGSIPVMYAHSEKSTVGVLNLVGSETYVDVSKHKTKGKKEDGISTHWISESGILDIFLFPGPTARDAFAQYADLTGSPMLPSRWSMGYHQCRWNYVSSSDVRDVQKRFDDEEMSVDVIWLDIEYARDHMYFMWREDMFPDPKEMIADVAKYGRKMVSIVDPHIKRSDNYPTYTEGHEKDFFIHTAEGKEYEGWCWPGSSSWVDFFNPATWGWWKGLYSLNGKDVNGKKIDGWHWEKQTKDLHIWNDMNEPSVFNGPEITMPKDNLHYGGWEHRDVHNINGMLYVNATYQSLLARDAYTQRPFVLTRSFFAGSQRFGAMWTGDNMGTWEHMAVGIPMVLSMGVGGMPFAGADVGGFFGNPSSEMLTRWYAVGIFSPFFRAHAHIDTKRREPYLLEEPYKSIVRDLLRLRYKMMPVWYTAAWEASLAGMPIVRPHFVVVPGDKNGFGVDDQYFIGDGLLVKPVAQEGVEEVSVYLPGEDNVYYHYLTDELYRTTPSGRHLTISAKLDEVAFFRRGGFITPTQERPRRASSLQKLDPYTLTIALDKKGNAKGELYIDDGESFNYRKGEFIWRGFEAVSEKKGGLTIRSTDLVKSRSGPAAIPSSTDLTSYDSSKNSFSATIEQVRVEQIVILGLSGQPKSIKTGTRQDVGWGWTDGVRTTGKKDGVASTLILKDPGIKIVKDWSITVEL